ncbi:MAG: hypothetical protein KA319_01300 [Ferruginibacter sp.]|nr:hypothetical protein [Ferruginibacter sp.]
MIGKEQQKAELLENLKRQYISTKYKTIFVEESETYIAIDDIRIDNSASLAKGIGFFLRESSIVYILFIISFCFMIGIDLYPIIFSNKKVSADNVAIFYGTIGLIVTISKYFLRKPRLSINNNGIYFYKWNNEIEWHNVAIIYYKTTTSTNEDIYDTKELLIHYYSEAYHTYLLNIISIADFEKRPEDIIAAIKYFKTAG